MENTTTGYTGSQMSGYTENNVDEWSEDFLIVKEIISFQTVNKDYIFELMGFDVNFNETFYTIELTENQINQMSKFVSMERAKRAFQDVCNK
jgi:hypothetical protein